MKNIIYLLFIQIALFCGIETMQGQNFKMAVLEGKYQYPSGLGYIEFSGDRYGYQYYVREEYDGRIYFGTYSFLPELNYNDPYYNTGNGKLTLNWWCGSNVETTVSGVGTRSLRIVVKHLGNEQAVRLSRDGNCTLTNQDIISQQNGSHPTYYRQTKPSGSSIGLGASYAGKWNRKDGRGSIELSPEGVMRYILDGKIRVGKFEYTPPYTILGDEYGSIYFYWHDAGTEKCFVTRLTNQNLTIEDSKNVNEYEYEGPKTILKAEADKIALNGNSKQPSKSVAPLKDADKSTNTSKQSIVGKWQATAGNEILEFSNDTYFRTSSKTSTDKSYGTYTHNLGNGQIKLHFYSQDNPVTIEIKSVSTTELILESGTTLPSRYRFLGKTSLSRNVIRTALGDDLDGQGGEGEHSNPNPLICATCGGDGSKSCNRCGGDGSINETYWEYDYNQERDVQRTRTITCPQCSGDGCEACDDFTCTRRRSISQHSEYVLRPALAPCRIYSSGLKYYLVSNGEGGYKIIWY